MSSDIEILKKMKSMKSERNYWAKQLESFGRQLVISELESAETLRCSHEKFLAARRKIVMQRNAYEDELQGAQQHVEGLQKCIRQKDAENKNVMQKLKVEKLLNDDDSVKLAKMRDNLHLAMRIILFHKKNPQL